MSSADTRLNDEARFELSLAAAGRERANRPRILVVGACVALGATVVGAVWGLSARGAGMRALRTTQDEQVRVNQMLQEWEQLDKGRESSSVQPGSKIEGLYSKMEQLATRAGIQKKPDPPRAAETKRGDVKLIEYHYPGLKDPQLKALLEWARLATVEIPGMEVYGLTLKPDPSNWSMNVTFRRWERAQ